MDFCLSQGTAYDTSGFGLLSDEQRSAVRAYLLHISEYPDYEFGRPHIIRALNEYWTAAPSI